MVSNDRLDREIPMKVNIDLRTTAPRTVLMGRYKLKDRHEFSPIEMGFVNPQSCLWWDSEWLNAGHSEASEEKRKIDDCIPWIMHLCRRGLSL